MNVIKNVTKLNGEIGRFKTSFGKRNKSCNINSNRLIIIQISQLKPLHPHTVERFHIIGMKI